MTLTMERRNAGNEPGFGFGLSGDRVPSALASAAVPGPPLVLKRGEPVEITVMNRLGEPTAVHWHGMELDSYYDGVHNWSGIERKLAPMIEPDASFVVRFTPPRSGTFIYHTHLHDERQLPLGLYGPMLVVDDDQAYQPEVDHVVVVGQSGIDPAAPDVLAAGDTAGDQWPDRAGVHLEGRRAASRQVHQHHTRQHRQRLPAERAGTAHVGAGGEGRRAAARRTSSSPSPRGRRSPPARPTTSRSTCRPDGERCGSRCEAPPASGRRRVR